MNKYNTNIYLKIFAFILIFNFITVMFIYNQIKNIGLDDLEFTSMILYDGANSFNSNFFFKTLIAPLYLIICTTICRYDFLKLVRLSRIGLFKTKQNYFSIIALIFSVCNTLITIFSIVYYTNYNILDLNLIILMVFNFILYFLLLNLIGYILITFNIFYSNTKSLLFFISIIFIFHFIDSFIFYSKFTNLILKYIYCGKYYESIVLSKDGIDIGFLFYGIVIYIIIRQLLSEIIKKLVIYNEVY